MLFMHTIAVYSQNYDTLCAKDEDLFNFKVIHAAIIIFNSIKE
jgi:hypothetical protein